MRLQHATPRLTPDGHRRERMGVTVELFRNESEVEEFADGETIFREGERGDAMFVVIEGSVEIRAPGLGVEVLGPGEVFGEMALIDQGPRAATVIARSACRVARVPEKRFLYMVRETPHFA